MLSDQEISQIENEVSCINYSNLLSEKEKLIIKGQRAGAKMETMMNLGSDHSNYEKEMHIMAEYLTWIDQRIEDKNGWWFRIKRRLKYVNQFRPKW